MLAVLLTGQFMCIIDVLVVNVAMPSIGARSTTFSQFFILDGFKNLTWPSWQENLS